MAVSTITICDKNKVRVLTGLPDCYHPICAVLTEDTLTVKVIYHEGKDSEPARIDASAACRTLGCFPSDLVMIDYHDDIGETFGGAPWVHDIFDVVCIPYAAEDEDFRVVDDFGDLY